MRGSYKQVLDRAWKAHLAPKSADAPTVVSVFAGCGGSSLGYSMAGFRELLAVDFDERCAETFRLNFPGVPFLIADLRKMSTKKFMEAAGLVGPGDLDILDGSPPCQGFSTAGKRDFYDLRNQLYGEFIKLLEKAKPKVFVMENVGGMVKGKMKIVFADCIRQLKAAGYHVSCRLLDAQWFLVPQERKRLIWIGSKDDLMIEPSHPCGLAEPISVAEALADLLSGSLPAIFLDDGRKRGWKITRPAFTIGSGCRTELISVKLERGKSRAPQMAAHQHSSLMTPRRLTDREVARLQSFPDAFQFAGNKTEVQQQIGNGVPPLFMRAIAGHVRSAILEQ